MLTIITYVSALSLGLLGLPREAIAAFASPAPVANLAKSVDVGAGSQGWYMRATLASPSVVNLGALNLTWQSGAGNGGRSDALGVRLGALNTTAPLKCDGLPHVVLQLDMQSGDYSARISKIAAVSETSAARVEYTCTPD